MKEYKQGKAKAQSEKQYVLIMVSANETDEVRDWFENLSAVLELEAVFTADIRGRPPLERPIGLMALLKFDSVLQMKTAITQVVTELRKHDGWQSDFMKANWIDIDSGIRIGTRDETKRLVRPDGRISFKNRRYYISERLRGEYVDLLVDGENLNVYHAGVLVKTLNLRS